MQTHEIKNFLAQREKRSALLKRVSTLICMAVLLFTDGLALLAASHISGLFTLPWSHTTQFDVPAFIAVACALLGFVGRGHYRRRKPFVRELRELLAVMVLACLLHMALLILDGAASGAKLALLLWFVAAVTVSVSRMLVKIALIKLGLWRRDVVIIGSGHLAADAMAAISSEVLMGLRVRGCVSHDLSIAPSFAPRLQLTPQDASQLGDAVVMMALEPEHAELRAAWLRALGSERHVDVILVADVAGMPLHGTAATYVKSHDLLLLQVRDNLSRWHVRFAKRCLDLIGAIAITLVLSPLLLFIAWQVRKDGGNAIYGHVRVGSRARSFKCYKFRSMVTNASAVLADLLERDPQARDEWGRDFKLKNDPRVTRIGRFLRRTSLDELPQLWNVIRGDMSLVGPRPIVEAELERYGDDAFYYLMARPGMTGLWQVSGRNDADYPTRVRLDAWYVRNWSLWYDIAIICKTARIVLKRDGAY